jgi:hypothetical protein
MKERRDLAATQFSEAVQHLIRDSGTLPQVLRLCFDASDLANLEEEGRWFQAQLSGYSTFSGDLPAIRQKIAGTAKVVPQEAFAATQGSPIRHMNDLLHITHPNVDDPPREVRRSVPEGIDWLINAASAGYEEPITDWETLTSHVGAKSTHWRWVASYPPERFRAIVEDVRLQTLQRARAAMIALAYGDAVEDIWNELRISVEDSLPKMGIANNLAAIREGIESQNPERWRDAMYACRSALVALSGNLWKDPSKTYLGIPRDGSGMKVDETAYINRLLAYLHCKGITGHSFKYIEAELERITSSLHALVDLDSKAHSSTPVDREDALLAVIGTCTMLSQFVRRTDLEPVTNQAECLPSTGSQGA